MLLFYAMSAFFLFIYVQELDHGAYNAGFFWSSLWLVIISIASLVTLLFRGVARTRALVGVSAIWVATTSYAVFSWLMVVIGWTDFSVGYEASLDEVLLHAALLAIPGATLLISVQRLKSRIANEDNPST